MELEFDVKIKTGDLYDYMLYHNYSHFSSILATILGALLIVIYCYDTTSVIYLLVGIVAIAYLPVALFLRAKRQAIATPSFKEPLHYKLTDQGMEVSQGGHVEIQVWDDMNKAVSTPRSIIIYTSKLNAAIFPKKDLQDKTPLVIEFISTHMPPSKVKIRS